MINVTVDFKEFKQQIERFEYDMPKIAKKMMAAVFSSMRKDAVRFARANFKRKSGRLFKAINYFAFDDWSGAITTRNKNNKTGTVSSAFYASFLERGTKQLSGKPFMRRAFDLYFGGNGALGRKIMEDKLQRQMDYIFQKHQGEK
jgi:hypothetical protein